MNIINLNLFEVLDKALLIIMAKWHGFGRCKTRLAKDIGKTNASKVQSMMINHTISVAKSLQKIKLIDVSIAIEISIGLVSWRNFATEIVCLVITLCIFAELLLPISFDNLVLHLPKPCHFAIMMSNVLSNTLVRFKIIICLLNKYKIYL